MQAAGGSGSLIEWAGDDRVALAIVFSDIVGSTTLNERLGDERYRELRIAHFAHSAELVTKYRGRRVETAGDSVVAVFRSAVLALDYACALFIDPGDPELLMSGVRVGVHVGEVEIVRDGGIVGFDVIFAARVQQSITGAGIRLSAVAREAIKNAGAVRHRDLGWQQHDDIVLKGLNGGFTLWSSMLRPSWRPSEDVSASVPSEPDVSNELSLTRPRPAVRRARPNGRRVFLARPASDMHTAYIRIVDELKDRGFSVIPDADIPNDESAMSFISTALLGAEVSIHLLGTRPGFTPDAKGMPPIGALQLACAALRTREPKKSADEPDFIRIIWAPRIFEDANFQLSLDEQRDPQMVLAEFGELISGDKLIGDNLIQFIEFLFRYLARARPRSDFDSWRFASGSKIFIDHSREDYHYATELAVALQELSLEPRLPVPGGGESPRKIEAMNRKGMLDCKAVALCWGSSSEPWVRAAANRIDSWRRSKAQIHQLTSALVAAPPRHEAKDRWLRIKLPGIDRVVDMTNVETPSPADLAAWFDAQAGMSTADEGW